MADAVEPTYDFTEIDIAPFVVTPAEFELKPGDAVSVDVDFVPEENGEARREFVMVCDNRQVKMFTVVGSGCRSTSSPPSARRPSTADREPRRPRGPVFSPLLPGSKDVQRVSIHNHTPLVVLYRWRQRALAEDGAVGEETQRTPFAVSGPGIRPLLGGDLRVLVRAVRRSAAPSATSSSRRSRPAVEGVATGAACGESANQAEADRGVVLRDYPVMGLRLHGAGKLAEVTRRRPSSTSPARYC